MAAGICIREVRCFAVAVPIHSKGVWWGCGQGSVKFLHTRLSKPFLGGLNLRMRILVCWNGHFHLSNCCCKVKQKSYTVYPLCNGLEKFKFYWFVFCDSTPVISILSYCQCYNYISTITTISSQSSDQHRHEPNVINRCIFLLVPFVIWTLYIVP